MKTKIIIIAIILWSVVISTVAHKYKSISDLPLELTTEKTVVNAQPAPSTIEDELVQFSREFAKLFSSPMLAKMESESCSDVSEAIRKMQKRCDEKLDKAIKECQKSTEASEESKKNSEAAKKSCEDTQRQNLKLQSSLDTISDSQGKLATYIKNKDSMEVGFQCLVTIGYLAFLVIQFSYFKKENALGSSYSDLFMGFLLTGIFPILKLLG